jgi:hypothetical protein
MTAAVDTAVADVVAVAQLDLPAGIRTLEGYVRDQCNELCNALQVVMNELPAEHLPAISSRWQYAQVQASMWQLVAYVRGQPIALDYVESTFAAAARRAMALADVVADIVPPANVPEPMLIGDIIATEISDILGVEGQ